MATVDTVYAVDASRSGMEHSVLALALGLAVHGVGSVVQVAVPVMHTVSAYWAQGRLACGGVMMAFPETALTGSAVMPGASWPPW